MDQALPVNRRQGTEHGKHHIQGLLRADPSARPRNVILKGNALDIVHDEIGGLIFVKIIRHPGDIGLPHKFGQNPGLLPEALLPVGKVLPAGRRAGHNPRPIRPDSHLAGHVLFHCHLSRKPLIPGQVSDAKSALAQHPANPVAPL